MKTITRDEVLRVLQKQINTLTDSFTDRIGSNAGKVSDPIIAQDIERLKKAKEVIAANFTRDWRLPSKLHNANWHLHSRGATRTGQSAVEI